MGISAQHFALLFTSADDFSYSYYFIPHLIALYDIYPLKRFV
ncbi:hypothetical protein SSCHL_0035 [Staphylococcus schleiferi]|nr:hypothetical protein SSCHL_0035 [Staphylococcus schleiferi]